ncbi:MAG: SpoIIE family protein phosphatase [Pseudomonadota bacterium]
MKEKRGIERRKKITHYGLLTRRKNQDRRKNSYISEQILWQGLPYDAVEDILDKCKKLHIEKGQHLLYKGAINRQLYLLIKGKLRVYFDINSPQIGFTINSGECIGEMSIIDESKSSAFVIAEENSQVIQISDKIFWQELAPHPGVSRNMLHLLADRLRKKNEVMQHAFEQSLRLEQLERDLDIAQQIQRDMLPEQQPFKKIIAQVNVYAFMQSARSIGGDFYDAFPIDEKHIFIAVGDVSGKGIPASLFMSRCLTLLRREVNSGITLRDVVLRVNQELCKNNAKLMFVSLFVATLCLDTGLLTYISCGHNPPIIGLKGNKHQFLKHSDNFFIGFLKDASYSEQHQQLSKDNYLVLYTDGITEAQNPQDKFFTAQRLKNSMLTSDETISSEQRVSKVLEEVTKFTDGRALTDDMTLLVLTYTPTN